MGRNELKTVIIVSCSEEVYHKANKGEQVFGGVKQKNIFFITLVFSIVTCLLPFSVLEIHLLLFGLVIWQCILNSLRNGRLF